MDERPDISIVLACYNEGNILEPSVWQICRDLDRTHWRYEIIFVDDHSRDETPQHIQNLVRELPRARCILKDRNQGRGQTVRDGLNLAQGRFIGFIDVDLEVHSRYIPSHIAELEDGSDVVLAYRVYRTGINPVFVMRSILSRGYAAISRKLLGIHTRDSESGFKFFRKEAYEKIKDRCTHPGWFWDTELVYFAEKAGLRVREIPCLFLRRSDKVSKLNVIPDTIQYALDLWGLWRRKD